MEFNSENITALAQNIFNTKTTFPERVQKTIVSFLELNKEIDNLYLHYDNQSQIWHAESKMQKSGKLIRLTKISPNMNEKATLTFKIENLSAEKADNDFKTFERDLLEAIVNPSNSTTSRVQKYLQPNSYPYTGVSSYIELLQFLKSIKTAGRLESKDKSFAEQILEAESSLIKLTSPSDLTSEDFQKFIELTSSFLKKDSMFNKKSGLVGCYFDLAIQLLDRHKSAKLDSVKRNGFMHTQNNVKLLTDGKKTVDVFYKFFKYVYERLEDQEKVAMLENLADFLEKNILVEESIEFLKDLAKGSEKFLKNLARMYKDTSVFEVLEFENQLNLFFDVEANFNILDRILDQNVFLKGDLLSNKKQYRVTCFFLSTVACFDHHRRSVIEIIKNQSATCKTKISHIIENSKEVSTKVVDVLKESLYCIRYMQAVEILQEMLLIEDSSVVDAISVLLKLDEKIIRGWAQSLRKSSDSIKSLMKSKRSFDMTNTQSFADFPQIKIFIEYQKEHAILKELTSDPLLDALDIKDLLILDEEITDLFVLSRQFFQNTTRWTNLVNFYNSLDKKYGKRQLSIVLKEISELESCLKSIIMENFENKISKGETLLRTIETNLVKVHDFESKTSLLLFKAAENLTGGFEFVHTIQASIRDFQNSFDPKASTGIALFVQHQMLKILFLHCKIILKNKKVFLLQGQPIKVQLRKSLNSSALETFPSRPAIRKWFFARIQDIFKIIKIAANGMTNEYLQVLIENHLKEDLEESYNFIENVMNELQQHIKSEISIELGAALASGDDIKSKNLIDMPFAELNENFTSTLNKLNFLNSRLKELESLPEYINFKNIVKIQTRLAKTTMIEETHAGFQSLTSILKTITVECVTRSENFIIKFNESINKRVENIEQFKSVNEFMQTVKVEKDRIQRYYQLLKDSSNFVRKSEGESLLVQRIVKFLKNWEKLQSVQLSSNIEIEKLRVELRKLLESQSIELKSSVEMFASKQPEISRILQALLNSELDYAEMKEKAVFLSEHIRLWGDISSKASDLKKNYESLDFNDPHLEGLWGQIVNCSQIFEGEDFHFASKILDFWQKILTFTREPWMNFSRHNWKKLNTLIEDLSQNIILENSRNNYSQSYAKTISRYQSYFKNYLSLITGEQYSNVDWLELMEAIGLRKINLDDFCFEHLLNSEIRVKSSLSQIREINMRINEEANIRKMLEEVMAWKVNAELKFVNYPIIDRHSFPVITEWDVLLDQISDYAFQVRIMVDSKFRNKFKDQLESLNEFMENIDGLYRELQIVQQRMIYLDPILLKAKFDEKSTTEEFNTMKAKLADFYKYLKDAKHISAILSFSHADTLLKEASKLFETIQRILQNFLENKRNIFTRLHLLSDEDLIELIGNCDSEQSLQLHLPKIFSAISGVSLSLDSVIREVQSQSSGSALETITFHSKINVKDFELENWLLNIQNSFTYVLKKKFKDYHYDHLDKPDLYKNLELNVNLPLQVLFITQEIIFESMLANALRSKSFTSLIEAYLTFIRDLNAQNNKADTKAIDIEKYKQIIMHSVRKIAILRDCAERPEDQKWTIFKAMLYQAFSSNSTGINDNEQLNNFSDRQDKVIPADKNKLNTNPSLLKNENSKLTSGKLASVNSTTHKASSKTSVDVLIKMAGCQLQYSWEYQGLKTPLVYTTITDKIFVCLARCILDRQGGNLTGPAGTGKTESVKFFAQHLARNVVVFNCDEELKFEVIGRIFKGFISEEAFACFDEFNRLNPSQMSVVSQLIQSLQFALKKAFDNKASVHMDDFRNFPVVNQNCAVFITMNPKNTEYGARYALPQNLKNLFRVINVSTPSEKQVFEVLLMAEGCLEYNGLAGKLSKFFETARQEFTRQSHYDWSLRKVKSVIASFKGFRFANLFTEEQSDLFCLLKAIETNILSYLLPSDFLKFDDIASAIFGEIYQTYKLLHLKKQGKQIAEKIDVSGSINFIFQGSLAIWIKEKLSYLENLLKARDGVILYGSPMSGKSILWKILLSQEYQRNSAINYYIINPKIGNKRLLLGKINNDTGEFIDGYLTQLLRKVKKMKEGDESKKDRPIFLIFDAEIDSEWIEALNSVLDDNKMLSLPNGERISVPSNVKFIFETRSLKYASPATLSRLGIISMESDWKVNFLPFFEPKLTNDGTKLIYLKFEDSVITPDMFGKLDNFSKGSQGTIRSKAQFEENQSQAKISPFVKNSLPTPQLDRKALEAISFIVDLLKIDQNQHQVIPEDTSKLASTMKLPILDNSSYIDQNRTTDFSRINAIPNLPHIVLTTKQSIDVISYKDSNTVKMFINFEDCIAKHISDKLVPEFAKILYSNIIFILDTLPLSGRILTTEIFTCASFAIIKGPVFDKYSESINSANDLSSRWPKSLESDMIEGQLRSITKVLLDKGVPIFIHGTKQRNLSKDLEQCTGLDFSSSESILTIPCTAKLKTKDILRLIKNNFQITTKNGKKFIESCGSMSEKNFVIFTNFEAIDHDCYDSAQIHEALYTIINYRFVVDSETVEVINFAENIAFVFACQVDYVKLFSRVPLKLLRKCFTICLDDFSETSIPESNNNISSNSLRDISKLELSDEILNLAEEVFRDIRGKLLKRPEFGSQFTPESIDECFETRIWKNLVLFPVIDKTSIKGILSWLIKSMLIVQVQSCETAILVTQLILDSLNIAHQSTYCIMRIENKGNGHKDELQIAKPDEFKAFFTNLKMVYSEQLQIKNLKPIAAQYDLLQTLMIITSSRRRDKSLSTFVLTGGRGKGRKTILNLFGIAEGFEVQTFQLQPTCKPLKEFRKFLITALNDIFISDKKIMLIIEEHQIVNQRIFDELIIFAKCRIIKGFEQEDRDNLVRLDPQYSKTAEKTHSLIDRFIHKLVTNLLVFVILDNAKLTVETLNQQYPAAQAVFHVVNCDYLLQNGYVDSYMEIQLERILSADELNDLKTIIERSGVVGQIEDCLSLSGFPTFSNFCENIVHLFKIKTQELDDKYQFFELGINKLAQAEQQVLELQKLAQDKSKLIQAKTVETEWALKQISEIYTKTKHKFETLKKAEEQLKEREFEIVCKKEEVLSQLSQILPILETARNQVKSVSKSHLDELRSLKNPPVHVVNVFTALLKLKNKEKTTFDEAKKILGTASEFEELSNFDFKKVDAKTLKNVKDFMEKEAASFDTKTIFYVSQAAGPIAEFVKAIVRCREFYSTIEPYEKSLESLEKSLEFAKKDTEALKSEVAHIEDEVWNLKNSYAVRLGETEIYKKELDTINKRLGTSNELLMSLPDEKIRWTQKLSDIRKTKERLIGLCFASSWQINFVLTKKNSNTLCQNSNADVAGNGQKMNEKANKISQNILSSQKNISNHEERIFNSICACFDIDDFDHMEFLTDEKFLVDIVNNGLPQNSRAISNVTTSLWSSGFPLIVDPSEKIIKYLKMKAGKSFISVGLHEKSLFQKLLTSLKSGNTLFIENFSSNFPSFLYPLMRRDFLDRSINNKEINICGKNVSVSNFFRVIFTTKFIESVGKQGSLTSDYLTLVDNSYGQETLTSYYISLVLEKFDAGLQKERHVCIEKQCELKEKLLQTERDLLESIGKMQGNLLDDDKLVKHLESIKRESLKIVEQISESQKLISHIKIKESKYMPLAIFLSVTFINISKIQTLNPFYNFSIDFYNFNVHSCLASFENTDFEFKKDKNEEIEISSFIGTFMKLIAKNYGAAITKEDFGLFLLLLIKTDRKIQVDQPIWDVITKDLTNSIVSLDNGDNQSASNTIVRKSRSSSKRISISLFKESNMQVYDPAQDDEEQIDIKYNENRLIEQISNLKDDAVEVLAEKMPELMNELRRNFESWIKWLESEQCELHFPSKSSSNSLSFSNKLLLTYMLRKDRMNALVLKSFEDCYGCTDAEFSFNPLHCANMWMTLNGPIVFQIKEGLDPSSDITLMLKQMQPVQVVEEISCGEGNSAIVLEKIVTLKDKTLILKNFHLCPKIYDEVTAVIASQDKSKHQRLIFITEDASVLPLELIDNSVKINYEKDQDFQQNLLKHYSLLGENRFNELPQAASNYLFSLVYLHVSLCEFEKSENIFKKKYELNWSDFDRAVNFLIQSKGEDSENFGIIFNKMLLFSLYGAKIDDPADYAALERFVASFFSFDKSCQDKSLELPGRFSYEEHKEKSKRAKLPRIADLGLQITKGTRASVSTGQKIFMVKLRKVFLD